MHLHRLVIRFCPDEGVKKAGGSALTDLDLGTVLANVADARQGKPLVLGLDACIMSALEVCYEVKDSADYVIASQSLVPSSGWPYHKFLARLYDAPEMDEAALCRAAVTEYQEYYNDYDDLPVQLSACRLAHTETVAQAVRELAAMLCDKLASLDLDEFLTIRNALLSAHLAAQHYDEFQFYDLYDFCYMLGEGCRDGKLQERCQAVMQALAGTPDGAEGFVVACASSSTCAALQFSSGVSIYFPWAEVSRRYQFMPFAKATNWHEFLEQYVANTAKLGRRHRVATANGQPAEWKIGALPFKKTADGQTAEWKIGALPFKKATAAENHTAHRAGAEAGNWKIGALPFKKAGLSQSGVPHVAIRASAAGPRKQAATSESLTLQRAGAEAGNWKIGALPFKKAGVSNVIGPQVAIRTLSDKSRKNGSPERRRK